MLYAHGKSVYHATMSKTGNDTTAVYDDPDTLRQQKAEAKLQGKQFENDIRSVMSTVSGRRVMWWLLSQAALGQDPMTGNSMTFYRLGEQAIGKKLHVALWTADKQAFRLMQDENE